MHISMIRIIQLSILLLDFAYGCKVGCADLSALQSAMPSGGFASNDQLSRMGMCGDLPSVCSQNGHSEDAFIALLDSKNQNQCSAVLAKWSPIQSSSASDNLVNILFENSEYPGSSENWRTNVTLVCDMSVEYAPFDVTLAYMEATANVEMRTKYVCDACSAPTPQPTPSPIPWGINGTFTGNMTAISAAPNILQATTITIQGDCKNMAAVTSGKGETNIWLLSMDECSGNYASGILQSELGNMRFRFNAYLLTDSNSDQLDMILMNAKFPYQAS